MLGGGGQGTATDSVPSGVLRQPGGGCCAHYGSEKMVLMTTPQTQLAARTSRHACQPEVTCAPEVNLKTCRRCLKGKSWKTRACD